MEDRSTGMSWIAVLFVIIVIFAIFGGNFGGGLVRLGGPALVVPIPRRRAVTG